MDCCCCWWLPQYQPLAMKWYVSSAQKQFWPSGALALIRAKPNHSPVRESSTSLRLLSFFLTVSPTSVTQLIATAMEDSSSTFSVSSKIHHCMNNLHKLSLWILSSGWLPGCVNFALQLKHSDFVFWIPTSTILHLIFVRGSTSPREGQTWGVWNQ